MNFKYLVYKFWYLFWFMLLPLAIAWTAVVFLNKSALIEEVEVWYVLLLFAGIAFIFYSVRDKLPFWKDRDPNSSYNQQLKRNEAKLLIKNIRKIISGKGDKVPEKGKAELEKAISQLESAIDQKDDGAVDDAVKRLESKSDRFLAFARKSAPREYFESIGIAILVAVLLRLFIIEAFKIPSESMVPTLMVGDHIFVSKYRYGLSVPFSNERLIRFAKPSHGEVVVFLKPSIEEQGGIAPLQMFSDEYEMVGVDFIKRIVGLPGDTVAMKQDVLFINGKEIPRCRVGTQVYRTLNRLHGTWEDTEAELWVEKHGDYLYTIIEESGGPRNDFGPTKVPEDQVFVLGDNRDNSNDSRYWGAVPFDNIKGRAMFIWWSNRRPQGFQWDRVGTVIMNGPKLDKKQTAALEKCKELL